MGNNIIRFNDSIEFDEFRKEKNLGIRLGSGTEGECFLSGSAGFAYKIFYNYHEKFMRTMYYVDEVITAKDIELKNFFLPEELYTIKNRLIAYKNKNAGFNIFDSRSIYEVDLDRMVRSYYDILGDVEKLSGENIKIYDLMRNLIFNGKDFIGIDTCSYTRVGDNPFKYNKFCLEMAVKDIIYSSIDKDVVLVHDDILDLKDNEDIEVLVKKVSKMVKCKKKKMNC